MGVAIADYDDDGRMDVFVANDRFPHFLYRNGPGGTFSEVGFDAGVAANESGAMVSGMGCDFKDFDGDGRPDIFVTDLVHDGFTLFVNRGRRRLHRPVASVRNRPRLGRATAGGARSSSTSTTTG